MIKQIGIRLNNKIRKKIENESIQKLKVKLNIGGKKKKNL